MKDVSFQKILNESKIQFEFPFQAVATLRLKFSPSHLNKYNYTTVTLRDLETALSVIQDVATGNMGSLCVTDNYKTLYVEIQTTRFEGTRQKADMAALLLQDLGVGHHSGLLDAISKSLILSDRKVFASRILSLNVSSGHVITAVTWRRPSTPKGTNSVTLLEVNGPVRALEEDPKQGARPDQDYPWYEDSNTSSMRPPKFLASPANISYKGWWTFPYYSCTARRWLISYSVPVPPTGRHASNKLQRKLQTKKLSWERLVWKIKAQLGDQVEDQIDVAEEELLLHIDAIADLALSSRAKGFLSVDVDVSGLQINQCDQQPKYTVNSELEIEIFRGTHKCHNSTSECKSRLRSGWIRGGYQCVCRPGFYARKKEPFNGTLVEAAWQEKKESLSHIYDEAFICHKCAPGCHSCQDPSPCLAFYNWPFRITLLTVSLLCVVFTLALVCYVFRHRRLKVFKVASPIFLAITLSGCAIMYLEMAAIFPVLDRYSCLATKWSRHLGFCITYTALLMKTWRLASVCRVSLTYRVKSAHKVKLTDKQLLQWMFPILLVMLIYLGAWTLSDPPDAEEIKDSSGLRFKQCTFNWWDHSIAIGEVLFLAWGIKVCYNVRNAESFYNEAHLISYAIYNIAVVNIAMVAFHILIFPQAGPDIKYLLGFIRTQLSTSVTVALVFGPKVARVWRGLGDQWDNRARARGVTASFSLNGIGLAPEETADLYQENEELKEEIQKLAGQIEFMKIVHMETNNRHLKPKTGSYFHGVNAQATMMLPSPMGRPKNTLENPH
ncbi:hypothetical protein RUM43_002033 [Polyplax serrata]|uniref:G-protein coupled receptors family 3 profile domain-containing protein n=1 Tax=Polyplax serrata TaxID=468196 RepID=A0AAN8S948_POLSC